MTFEEAFARAAPISCCPQEKLLRLWIHANDCLGLDGDLAEFGVWRGGSASLLLGLLRDRSAKALHLYDTFSGIPESTKGADDDHRPGDFSDTLFEQVERFLTPLGRVVFHRGEFQSVARLPLAFVHIDADMERSYELALPLFWKRLVSGGRMVFDDYAVPSCRGATIAVDRWAKAAGVKVEPHGIYSGGAWVEKP